MMLRARNLFLAWLAYGALQLALLGVPGAAAQRGVGPRGARQQTETESVSFGKRALASELSHRRAPITPFAPSTHVRLDLPTPVGREPRITSEEHASAFDPLVLPPARGPPPFALS